MEFESNLPIHERPGLEDKAKKTDKKSRKKTPKADSEQSKKEQAKPDNQKPEQSKLHVGVTELLNRPPEALLSRAPEAKKKKKKKKPGEIEPAEAEAPDTEEGTLRINHEEAAEKPKESKKEVERSRSKIEDHAAKETKAKESLEPSKEKSEKLSDYRIDEMVEIELSGNRETVVALRLPEVDFSHAESKDSRVSEPEPAGEWTFAEALAEVEEQLAAESAGISLPEHFSETSRAETGKSMPEGENTQVSPALSEKSSDVADIEQKPEQIMAAVAEAYESDEGGAELAPATQISVPSTAETITVQAPPEDSTSVFKKLESFENYTHQKLRRIRNFTERTFEQTRYPGRRDNRLEQIYSNQLKFESRRLESAKSQETYERLIVNKAAQFSNDNLPEEARLIKERLELELPPDHRLERSAWLSIEVDKKTGRVVDNPTIEYGEEYYNERQQEALEAEPEEVAVASGQLAVGGAGTVSASQTLGGSKTSALADKSRELYNKLESTIPIREYRPNSAGDLALWAALFLVITAIVIAAKI